MIRHKSVLFGNDSEAIDILIDIHCETLDPYILDCTYNKGVMWKKTIKKPLATDINPLYKTDIIADFTTLPFKADSFDVIVFDPPHIPSDAASKNASKLWYDRYGITEDESGLRTGDNVNGQFYPFLIESQRVLRHGGLVLAKIADIIHNHKYQWQHVALINDAVALGMQPCDMLIKTTPSSGNMISGKWENVYHLRRSHSYWIVIRNASYDERKNKDKFKKNS